MSHPKCSHGDMHVTRLNCTPHTHCVRVFIFEVDAKLEEEEEEEEEVATYITAPSMFRTILSSQRMYPTVFPNTNTIGLMARDISLCYTEMDTALMSYFSSIVPFTKTIKSTNREKKCL